MTAISKQALFFRVQAGHFTIDPDQILVGFGQFRGFGRGDGRVHISDISRIVADANEPLEHGHTILHKPSHSRCAPTMDSDECILDFDPDSGGGLAGPCGAQVLAERPPGAACGPPPSSAVPLWPMPTP